MRDFCIICVLFNNQFWYVLCLCGVWCVGLVNFNFKLISVKYTFINSLGLLNISVLASKRRKNKIGNV